MNRQGAVPEKYKYAHVPGPAAACSGALARPGGSGLRAGDLAVGAVTLPSSGASWSLVLRCLSNRRDRRAARVPGP